MPNQTPQKKKHKKIEWRRVLVILLAASMLIALVLPLLGSLSSHAATQGELKDQISSLKDTAAAAKQRKKELADQLAAINSDKAKALERKNLMDQQLYAIDAEIANTQSQGHGGGGGDLLPVCGVPGRQLHRPLGPAGHGG